MAIHILPSPHDSETPMRSDDYGAAAQAGVRTPLAIVTALAQAAAPPEREVFQPARRLVVLVPEENLDEGRFVRLIWSLASTHHLSVLFLCLNPNPVLEARARRRLVTLTALTQDDQVPVQAHLASGANWVQAVQAVWQPGDFVVCQAEQWTRVWGRLKPLSEALVITLKMPVGMLSGLYSETPVPPRGLAMSIFQWGGLSSIGLGFLWLQMQIVQQTQNEFQTLLLCLSVLAEYGLMAFWHRHFIEEL